MTRKRYTKPDEINIRRCANIRSRRHPDSRCPCFATHGEFCARHFKNPVRYHDTLPNSLIDDNVKNTVAKKIQTWWRITVGLLRFQRQGPVANNPVDAENQTDIYTLDPTLSIPMLYRWSYADSKKHMWIFDVRSLSMTRAQDSREDLLNPYTREKIPASAEKSFHERCEWLRKHKYCIVHTVTNDITPEQLRHQQILDVTMKYDVLGYHTCLNWFEELTTLRLWYFYKELWELWYFRLDLSLQIKEQVVPNWHRQNTLLFKWVPNDLTFRHDKQWWQKTILEILNRLVSSAELKEHRILGALYGMTAFAIVSPRVREYYPWLVEIAEDY